MKRIVVALLCCACAACLIRCGKNDRREDGRVTVVFWHSFVASTIPALDQMIKDFELSHPAVHIQAQYVPTGDGLIQKLVTAVQSRTAPDVSWIHTDFLDQLVDAGALVPIREFQSGPDGLSDSVLADFFPPLLESSTRNGVLYSLPMEATSIALFYNKRLFRASGLDPSHPPATWRDLEEDAARLTTRKTPGGRIEQYGFFVPVFPASGDLNIWMTLQWLPFLWQAGGTELDESRTHLLYNSTAGVEALSLWKRLYDMQDMRSFGIAHDLGFASEKVAMVIDGPWNLPRYRAMKNVDWGVVPLPAGPAGRATYLAGEQLAIFRQSERKAEAWEFVRWFVQPDVQAKFSILSGYLPVRKSTLALKDYQNYLATDPALRCFVEQMANSRARQYVGTRRVEINRVLAEAIEKATLGGCDAAQCLNAATERGNHILEAKP